ncbi:hypothetical protein [Paenibacillus shenyangensis]|uniref:hypothetical protein n=1 Tax=Paenibacillus sp. A9 TaxID=1284352 RepID=UPI00036F94B4|nr:hypothetical protein [Paenibacillus sp. A9]
MTIPVSYGENIIVAVRLEGSWSWYVTEKEYWFMDLPRFEQAFAHKGHTLSADTDYDYRFHIPVLNENTVHTFLKCIQEEQFSVADLHAGFIAEVNKHGGDSEFVAGWTPSLLLDFDQRQLFSYFPEPASFEQYVPDGWTGHYENFMEQLPDEQKYWL